MPARASFSYAIIRVVPRVDRGEFVNAGVVLHCPERGYLGAVVALDPARALQLFPDVDLPAIERHLALFAPLSAGDPGVGPLAQLSLSERFHWMVAPRSTIVQISPVHTGLTDDPPATLAHLVDLLVRPPAPPLTGSSGAGSR
jgi:hypothetical protein